MRYIVVVQHRSEHAQPIHFAKGCFFIIGEKYEGPEDWDIWFFCRTPDSQEGWVPGQVVEQLGPGRGKALENYTALELNVNTGDVLIGTKKLNGWVWCHRPSETGSGWVPLKNLRGITQ
ncbi:ligand-binding protein SH3 [Janthinobacterium sp. BJB1]|nr:ligand-binding protein SH3 [Janthinobacterium sp. BJB1]